ncbi:MAG TPA: hypothetical protein VFU47_01210, partial [Armatimonadota bacterium]|nr:hypothetical protein [Armatimonadota bacterium]
MLVYGDPAYTDELPAVATQLRRRLHAKQDADAESVRTLLIAAGQLEQAALDAVPQLPEDAGAALQATTDLLASALVATWSGGGDTEPPVRRAAAVLDRIELPKEAAVRVKVPEGFAFYALYPEQYSAAALSWWFEVRPAEPLVVVGIRSIGTTLSAVVNAVLRGQGCRTRRLTVRPEGHPYERRVEIASEALASCRWALVVDEGPGRSGSSMAAVAAAVERAGIARERIVFFPGHGGEPGEAASPETRAWWSAVPRCVMPLGEVRWAGRSLRQLLALRSEVLLGASVARTDDLGGGLWRRELDPAGTWPPAYTAFEVPKYRCSAGDGRAVLWKFAGLSLRPDGRTRAESAFEAMRTRSAGGLTPEPLDTCHGFVGYRWIEGRPCEGLSSVTLPDLALMGRYIAEAAGAPLDPPECSAAQQRLTEMLYWNTHEALGVTAAERARAAGV